MNLQQLWCSVTGLKSWWATYKGSFKAHGGIFNSSLDIKSICGNHFAKSSTVQHEQDSDGSVSLSAAEWWERQDEKSEFEPIRTFFSHCVQISCGQKGGWKSWHTAASSDELKKIKYCEIPALVSKVYVCVCCFCTVVFFWSDQVGGELQHGADQVCRSLHNVVHKPHRVRGDPGQAPWCGRRHKHIWLFSPLPAPIIRFQHNFWSNFLKAWVRCSEELGVKLVGETNAELVLDSVKERKKSPAFQFNLRENKLLCRKDDSEPLSPN